MQAEDFLSKAKVCENTGRILESQYLYSESIQKLINLSKDEKSVTKRNEFGSCINFALDRAEQIKLRVQRQQHRGGEIERHISIYENSVNHSYNTVFGEYLTKDVLEVLLEEPYLKDNIQFQNFSIFFELLLKKCCNLKFVKVVTKICLNNPQAQHDVFQQMQTYLKNRNITLEVVFEDSLHDRKITLFTSGRFGYIIKIGRGLHYFQWTPLFSIGCYDYDFRKCRQTEIDILRTEN